MKRIIVCLSLAQCVLGGHYSYQGTQNTKFSLSSDYSVYSDSVAGCCFQCNQLSTCKGMMTRYVMDDSGDSNRAFECLMTSRDDYLSYLTGAPGYVTWTKKTSSNTQSPRPTKTVSPSTSVSECPVVWKSSWPSTGLGPDWNARYEKWLPAEGDNKAERAIDNDNTTLSQTVIHNNANKKYPYLYIDLGRSFRVTKVSILGGDDPVLNPLMNLEVKVGPQETPEDYSCSNLVDTNQRCGVFYGPSRISNQWIEVDCGYRRGMLGQYITIQLTDRFIPSGGGRLEIKEVEVQGWARECGHYCLQSQQSLGPVGDEAHEWRLVRHVPKGNNWHPANDMLRGTHQYGDPNNMNAAWSKSWSNEDYDQLLITTDDFTKWVLIDKVELLGTDNNKYYDQQPIKVIASSSTCDPHSIKMMRRNGYVEEPIIPLRDYGLMGLLFVLYKENNNGGHNELLQRFPMQVYIRKFYPL